LSEPILQVKELKKYFPIRGGVLGRTVGFVYAVDGVSFDIDAGKTMGLVGESGCGKTTVGRCVLRLIEPTAGEIIFDGINLIDLKEEEMRKLRCKMQIVFQDPYASLNPRWLIKDIVGEPLIVNNVVSSRVEMEERVLELLTKVGLSADHLNRFPHEFSGGQRQRIGIARALALNPQFLVLDEPTSSLDVSVQAQTLNILKDLQSELRLTYLFISHNLSVIRHMSNRIGVMYLGRIVEIGSRDEMFRDPIHPYTKALLYAIPVPDPEKKKERMILGGDVPSPANPPKGCRFRARCPNASERCNEKPEMTEVSKGHYVACYMTQ
jgi:oligopeptide transport system ATP-binding protein